MSEATAHEWLHNEETNGYFACPTAVVDVYLNAGWKRSEADPAIEAQLQERLQADREKAEARQQERDRERAEYEARLLADPVALLLHGFMYHCVDCMGEEGEPSYEDWPFEVAEALRAAKTVGP